MKTFNKLSQIFGNDISRIENIFENIQISEVAIINEIIHHIISSGGKRIRPLITCIAADLCNVQNDKYIHSAAAIELIHTATLLHDDVIDDSETRRGIPTANRVWNNSLAVLVGDFLFGYSFGLINEAGSLEINNAFARTAKIISEGEVIQLQNLNNIYLSEELYYKIIYAKTASLFELACDVGSITANAASDKKDALHNFGYHFGIAFQIIDDSLDYFGNTDSLGKKIGTDFAEQKLTLPIIHNYRVCSKKDKEFWKRVFAKNESNENDFDHALELLNKYESNEYLLSEARRHTNLACECLESHFSNHTTREILIEFVQESVERLV